MTSRVGHGPDRRAGAVLGIVLALLVVLPILMAGSGTALAANGDKKGTKKPSGPSTYSQTKILQRVFKNADGSTSEFQANGVTVTVDQTKNLRGRQRVLVSWSGAQPSAGRAANPYGENGMQQEYPVVVMQCRGVDDPSLPVALQVRPETCFTASVNQRSQIARSTIGAAWRADLDAPASGRQRLSGLDPFPGSDVCKTADRPPFSSHLTPFVAANGTTYPACDADHMPPEAAVGAAFPPNEVAAFTDLDGNGSVRFEVRSDVENESLGCSDKVACSIVVVPINGLSCDAPAPADPSSMPSSQAPSQSTAAPATETSAAPTTSQPTGQSTSTAATSPSDDPSGTATTSASPSEPTASSDPVQDSRDISTACRQGGRFEPGSNNFANQGIDQAVGPALWWSPSNWKNRFAVPVTFGLPPDTCDVLDKRAPTGFYGSELLAQAALQWSPAYCLDKKRFKFQLNQMSDEAGFALMQNGGGAAAIVSSQHKTTGDTKVGYAPTAVTGFGIAYDIDLPNNEGEYTNLRLNARLIAKLMTESYLGSDLGRQHPGIETNPLSLQVDPEFIALNPGLSTTPTEAGAALLNLSSASDVVEQLTSYMKADPDARAFIDGKPDPWGMKVNPAYKKIKLPQSEWPLLDSFIPTTNDTCRKANPAVYFTQLAAPVTALRKISDALLDGWPNVQTRCDFDQNTNAYKLGRIDRQNFGARFMLGVVSLGDQQRFGLRSAALQTGKDKFVGADAASINAAVKLSSQKQKYAPFVLDQGDVRKSGNAYPGTMIVYTAARLQDAVAEDAAKVAQFIRVSSTEGQQQGAGNGELPAGFIPISDKGATAKLYRSAQVVADAVARSASAKGDGTTKKGDDSDTGTTTGTTSVSDPPTSVEAPTTDDPGTTTDSTTDLPSSEPVAMPRTTELSSGLASRLLPLLLLVGVLGLGAATGARFFVRPPRGKP